MMLSIATAVLIGFKISLVFEAGVKKEMERYHYGWFCYLSVTSGKDTERTGLLPYYAGDFRSRLTHEEIMEIKNIVDELLEMEEDEYVEDDPPVESEPDAGNDDGDIFSIDTGDTS